MSRHDENREERRREAIAALGNAICESLPVLEIRAIGALHGGIDTHAARVDMLGALYLIASALGDSWGIGVVERQALIDAISGPISTIGEPTTAAELREEVGLAQPPAEG